MTQEWILWIHPVGRPGYGRGFLGTHKEAEEQAKKEAGNGGKFSVKQTSHHKPHTPVRRHSRP